MRPNAYPFQKISRKFIHDFSYNPADKLTNRQTEPENYSAWHTQLPLTTQYAQ